MRVFLSFSPVGGPASMRNTEVGRLVDLGSLLVKCIDAIRCLFDRKLSDLEFVIFQRRQATAVVATELKQLHPLHTYLGGQRLLANVGNNTATLTLRRTQY